MIDRTHLLALFVALRLRLAVLVFAVSWAFWVGQVFSGGVEVWGLALKILIWAGKKILKRRKQRKERASEKRNDLEKGS